MSRSYPGNIWHYCAWETPRNVALPNNSKVPGIRQHRFLLGTGIVGFLMVLASLMRWPDWQLPALFCRGFRVAGLVEALNVYPRIFPAALEAYEL